MSASTRVGAAVAAGYVLGRFKKMRLALLVGSALANDKVRTAGLGLLQDSTRKVVPVGDARSGAAAADLMGAGRAAAAAVASSGMERLSDRLHERTRAMRGDADEPDEPEDVESEDVEDEDFEDEEPEDVEDEDFEDEDFEDEEPEDFEDEDVEDEEPEDLEDEDAESEEPEEHSRATRRSRAAAPAGRS